MKKLDEIKSNMFFEDIRVRSIASRKSSYSTHSYYCSNQTAENKFEFYNSKTKSHKTVIYLHGGGWSKLNLEISSFLSKYFTEYGFNFVPIGFNPATLSGMTNLVFEIQSALKEILRVYSDQTEVYIMGHSAGAHLSLLTYIYDLFPSDLQYTYEERKRIHGLILLSGTYDLRFICQNEAFSYLNMNSDEAWNLSPLRCVSEIKKYNSNLKIFMIVEDDPDFHFLKQSQDLWHNLKQLLDEKNILFLIINDVDHFDIVRNIGDDTYEVTEKLRLFLDM